MSAQKLTKTLVPGGHVFKADYSRHPLGVLENFDLGEPHDGPYCVRCEDYFCRNCGDEWQTEKCPEQDETLPGLEYS